MKPFLLLLILCASLPCFGNGELSISINPHLKLDFIYIPSGEFFMGDKKGQDDEKPIFTVTLNSFYMQTHELTKGQFSTFATEENFEETGCWYFDKEWFFSKKLNWQNPGYQQSNNDPVVCVSWHHVIQFIAWLNKQNKDYLFRLPTEAEWEYAARAGSNETYFWGEDSSKLCTYSNIADKSILTLFPHFSVAKCDDGYIRSAPVKQFKPNKFGLYDMYGNAWEWVQDCWNTHYHKAPNNGDARLDGDCDRRGFRGGGWGDIPRFARSGIRNRTASDNAKDDIGFRLVVEKR